MATETAAGPYGDVPATHREIHLVERPTGALIEEHFTVVEAPVPSPGRANSSSATGI